MDICLAAKFVVTDCKREALLGTEQRLLLFFHPQVYTLFEVLGVHWMGELHRGHHLFELGVPRVLVELASGYPGLELRGLEIKSVFLQKNMAGKHRPLEAHLVFLTHGPVLLWRESELRVAYPPPRPANLRHHADAFFNGFVHHLKRRGGAAEVNVQPLRLCVLSKGRGAGYRRPDAYLDRLMSYVIPVTDQS